MMETDNIAFQKAVDFLEDKEFSSLLLVYFSKELKQKFMTNSLATSWLGELDWAFKEYQRVGDRSDKLGIKFEKLISKLNAMMSGDFNKSTETLAQLYFDLYRQWMSLIAKKGTQNDKKNTYPDSESPIRKASDYIDNKVLVALILTELAKELSNCVQSNKSLLNRLEVIKWYHGSFERGLDRALVEELKLKIDSTKAFVLDMVRQDFDYASGIAKIYFNLYRAWLDDFEEKQLPLPVLIPEVFSEEKPEVKKEEKRKKPKPKKTEIIKDETYYSGPIGAKVPQDLMSSEMIK